MWLLWFFLVLTGASALDCTCTYRFGEVVETEVTCSSESSIQGCDCVDATNPLLPLVRVPSCPGTLRVTSSLTYDAFAVTSLCNRLVPVRLPRIPPFLVECAGAECGGQTNGTRTVVIAVDRTNATCSFTRRIESCTDPTPCVANQACVVSPWSVWSGCSRTCSDGVQYRTRTILRAENRTTCPSLRESLNCSWLTPCTDTNVLSRLCSSIEQAASPCGNATGCIVNCTSAFTNCRAWYPACNASLYNSSVLELDDPTSPRYLYRQCGVHATSIGPPCTCMSATSVVAHAGLPCNGIQGLCRSDEIQFINQTCSVSVPWSQRVPENIYDQSRELTRSVLPTDVVCNNLQRQELCGLGNVSQCRWPYLEKCVCAPGTLQDGYRCLAQNESYTRNCTDEESRTCTRCSRYSSPGICAEGLQCLVDCNGNTTGCVRRNTTCTEITLQVLECDTRDRIRYCGETAVGCTWEVLYDPSQGILQRFEDTLDCYCGPMAVSLPLTPPYWNYGRPCATALSYQVPCTVAQMASSCNTSLTQESSRLNEDPRFCLQRPLALSASDRVVPGTCPSDYVLRNCTEEEVYRHCPLADHVGCKMACPATTSGSGASTGGGECRRWGECTIRRACTVPEAARYCGKFGTACVIDLEDRAGVASQVVLNASSCEYTCELPWYGFQCQSNVNEGPCTVERGIQACGGPWQWHTCTSRSLSEVECGCRDNYSNPVPTVMGRNASLAYLDTQLYGYCSGQERNCSNETERHWYAGEHALHCTLWCAVAQPEDCRLGSYTCSAFSFPQTRKGFYQKSQGLVMDLVIPCATRTVFEPEYDAQPSIVQSYCGRGARSMSASLTYLPSGVVETIDFVPGSCVCQDNFFASDQFACDATFYQRDCTEAEVALVPRDLRIGCPLYQCRRLCYPARGTRGELCFAHAPDACLDHVSLWASLPPALALRECGDYVAAGMARCVFRSDLSFSRVCAVTNVSCHCVTADSPEAVSAYSLLPRLVYQNVTALQTLGGGIRPCDELYDVQPCESRAEAFVLCGVSPFALSCTKRKYASGKPDEAHVCVCEAGFSSAVSPRVCATRIQGEVCDSIGNAPCGAHTLRIDYACTNQSSRVDCTPLCTCLPQGVTYQGIPCGGIRRECTEAERRSRCGGRVDLNCQMDCAATTPSGSTQYRSCIEVPGACSSPRVTPAARRVTEAPAAAVRTQCGPASINCTWDVVFQRCIPGTCVCVSGTTAVLFEQKCEYRHHVFRSCASGVTAACGPSHVYGCRERRVFLTSIMTSMMGFPTRARSVMVSLLVDPASKESRFLEPNPTAICQTRITSTALQDQAIQGMRFLSMDDDLSNPAKPFYWYNLGSQHTTSTFSMAGVPIPGVAQKCMPDGFVASDGQPLWRVSTASATAVQIATSVLWLRECLCQSDPYALQPGPPYWWSIATALNTSSSRLSQEWRTGVALNPVALQDRLWCNYETLELKRRNGACPVTPTNNLACNGQGVCSYWRQSVPVVCRQYRQTYASCITNAFRTKVDGNAPVKAFVDLEGYAALIGANRSIFDSLYTRAGPLPSNFASLVAALSIPPPGAPSQYASYVDFSQTLLKYTQDLTAAQAALDAATPTATPAERRLQDYGPCTDYINQVALGRVLPGTGIPIGCRAILETDLMTNARILEVYLPQHVFRTPLRDKRTQTVQYLDFITRSFGPVTSTQVHQVLFNMQCGMFSQYFENEGDGYEFSWQVQAAADSGIIGLVPNPTAVTYNLRTFVVYNSLPTFYPVGYRGFIEGPGSNYQYTYDIWTPLYIHPWMYTGFADQIGFASGNSWYTGFLKVNHFGRFGGDQGAQGRSNKAWRALSCSQSIGSGLTRIGSLQGSGNCTEFRPCYYTALTDVMSGAYTAYRLGAQTTAAFRLQYGARQIDTIIARIKAKHSGDIGFYNFGLLSSYMTIKTPHYTTNAVKNLFYRAYTIRDYYMPLFWYWNKRCVFSRNNPLVQGLPSFTGTPATLWPFLRYPWRPGYGLTVQALNVWIGMLSQTILQPPCPFCDYPSDADLTYEFQLTGQTIDLRPASYIQELIASQSELMGCLSPFMQDFVIPEPTEVVLGNGCSQWSALASFCDTQQAYTGSCEDVLPSIQQMSAKILDVTRTTLDRSILEVRTAVGLLEKYSANVLSDRDSCQSLTCRNCTTGWKGDQCHIRDCPSFIDSCYPGFVGLCGTPGTNGWDRYVPGAVPSTTCCDGQPCYLPLDWTGRVGCVNGYFDWYQSKCICDVGWTYGSFGTCTTSKCPLGKSPTVTSLPTWPKSDVVCSGKGLCVMSDPNSLSGVCECNSDAYGSGCAGTFSTDCTLTARCAVAGHGVCSRNAQNTAVICLCASSNYDTRMGLPSVGCPTTALPGFVLDTSSASGSVTAVSQCRYVRVLDYTYTEPIRAPATQTCSQVYCDYFGRCGCSVPNYVLPISATAPSTLTNTTANPKLTVNFSALCPPSICPYPYRRDEVTLSVQCACILDRYDWPVENLTYEWRGSKCDVPWAPCQNGGTAVAEPSALDPHRIVCRCPAGFAGLYCDVAQCPRTASNHTCNGYGSCSASMPRDCRQPLASSAGGQTKCVRSGAGGTTAVDFFTGGCLCDKDLRTFCQAPGSENLCSGDQRPDGRDTCVPQVNLLTQRVEYSCNCSEARQGQYCEDARCTIPPELRGYLAFPCNGRTCVYNAVTQVAQCQCNKGTVLPLSLPVLAGSHCEYDVTAACGYNPPGTPFQSICNNRGSCVYNISRSNFQCQCQTGYTGAVCQLSICQAPCAFGTCVPDPLNPSGSVCRCTHPNVIGYNVTTGSCTTNQCGAGFPNEDGTQCVCSDRTRQPPLCLQARCVRINGELCGPWAAGDIYDTNSIAYADGTRSSRYKYCTPEGQCVCNPFLYNTSVTDGSCIPKCNQTHTTGAVLRLPRPRDPLTGIPMDVLQQCVCEPGFTTESFCTEGLCLPQKGVFDVGTSSCTCRAAYNGTRCGETKCGSRGVPNADGSLCICTPPWTGDFCETQDTTQVTLKCSNLGRLINQTYCQCVPPFTGPTCDQHLCVGGIPGPVGSQTCICNSTEWTGNRCDIRLCRNNGVFVPENLTCACTLQWTGPLCETRKCGTGGNYVRVGSFEACLCTGLWQRDVYGNCTDSVCVNGQPRSPGFTACDCTPPYVENTTTAASAHRCQLPCSSRGNYSLTTRSCVCVDGYHGLLCETEIISSVIGATNGTQIVTVPLTPTSNVTVTETVPGAGSIPDVYQPTNDSMPIPGGGPLPVPTTPQVPDGTLQDNVTVPILPDPEAVPLATLAISVTVGGIVTLGIGIATVVVFF